MDAVFLHWRIPEAVSASFMPPGVAPDVFDGSAWVGLIGFRMQGAGLGRGPGVPYFGSFNEINVRLYSREPDGTRGVVFRSSGCFTLGGGAGRAGGRDSLCVVAGELPWCRFIGFQGAHGRRLVGWSRWGRSGVG